MSRCRRGPSISCSCCPEPNQFDLCAAILALPVQPSAPVGAMFPYIGIDGICGRTTLVDGVPFDLCAALLARPLGAQGVPGVTEFIGADCSRHVLPADSAGGDGAQNGLNDTVAPGFHEWGGTLLHHTAIVGGPFTETHSFLNGAQNGQLATNAAQHHVFRVDTAANSSAFHQVTALTVNSSANNNAVPFNNSQSILTPASAQMTHDNGAGQSGQVILESLFSAMVFSDMIDVVQRVILENGRARLEHQEGPAGGAPPSSYVEASDFLVQLNTQNDPALIPGGVYSGLVQMNAYPNTRNEQASFPPANFLYTDVNGNVRSAPITASPVETPITVVDTPSVNITASGAGNHTIQADVNISASANNLAVINPDGLFVAQTPLVATDSATIDFTTSGVAGHGLTGSVKISALPENVATAVADGIFVPSFCLQLGVLPTGPQGVAGVDFYLGPDCEFHLLPAAGGGGAGAQNGLNQTVAPGFNELGGTLLHGTTINQQTFQLALNSASGTVVANMIHAPGVWSEVVADSGPPNVETKFSLSPILVTARFSNFTSGLISALSLNNVQTELSQSVAGGFTGKVSITAAASEMSYLNNSGILTRVALFPTAARMEYFDPITPNTNDTEITASSGLIELLGDLSSFVRMTAYPNTRNDAGVPVNILSTDASGNIHSNPVSDIPSSFNLCTAIAALTVGAQGVAGVDSYVGSDCQLHLLPAAGGGGSGTVNAGVAKQMAFYPATAAAVSGTPGFEYQAAVTPNVRITAQNVAHVALQVFTAPGVPTASPFQVSATNGAFVHFEVTTTGAPSAPGAGVQSERYGRNSQVGAADQSLAVGNGAIVGTVSTGGTAIGALTAAGSRDTVIGANASSISGTSNTLVGEGASSNGTGAVGLGRGVVADPATFVVGSNAFPIPDVFFGKGLNNATPTTTTIHGTDRAAGTDVSGATGILALAGGRGRGTGIGASVIIRVAPVATTGSALNPFVDSVEFPAVGGFIMPEVVSPATPAANKGHFFVKDVGGLSRPHFKGDDGLEFNLAAGSASWSGITDPSANLSLAMGSNITTFTWAGNYAGSALKLVGSNNTPTGALLHLSTGVATLMPPLLIEPRGAQRLLVTALGNTVLGQSSIGGGDTDGHVYIPVVGSNAFPTSTPTAHAGFAPIEGYSNGINGEFGAAIYVNGVWRDLTGWRNRYVALSGTGAQNIDFNAATSENVTRQYTFTGNSTFTFLNPPPAGSLITLVLVQGGAGSFTATWPGIVKWAGGAAPVLSTPAGSRDIVQFVWDGSNYWETGRTIAAA